MDHSSRPLPSGAVLHSWLPGGPVRGHLQLQHGFVEYTERYFVEYSRLGQRLLELGLAVHGIDLVGHGSAAGPRGVVNLVEAVDDHIAVRRELLGHREPVLLLGHSLGGLVTAASVARNPEGVAAAVVMSPALVGPVAAPARAVLRRLARLRPAAPAPMPRAPMSNLTARAEVVARAQADPRMPQMRVPMLVGASVLDLSAEAWRAVPSWRTPALFVHGDQDRWTNPIWSDRLVQAIGRDDVVRVEVAGGRHELLHDTDADQTMELVLGWLAGRL